MLARVAVWGVAFVGTAAAIAAAASACTFGDYDGSYEGGADNGSSRSTPITASAGGVAHANDANFEIDVPPGALAADGIVTITPFYDTTRNVAGYDVVSTAALVAPAIVHVVSSGGASATASNGFSLPPYFGVAATDPSYVGLPQPDAGTPVLLPAFTAQAGANGGFDAVTTSFGRFTYVSEYAAIDSFAACPGTCNVACDTSCRQYCNGGSSGNGGGSAPCSCVQTLVQSIGVGGGSGSTSGDSYAACYLSCNPQAKDACGDCLSSCCPGGGQVVVSNGSGGSACGCLSGGDVQCVRQCVAKGQGPSCSVSPDVPPGGATPTPGSVICNTMTPPSQCKTASTGGAGCCVTNNNGPNGCLTGTSGTPTCQVRECEEAADCASGNVCCAGPSGSSRCAPTCAAGAAQLCRRSSECASHACVVPTGATDGGAGRACESCDGVPCP